MTAERCVILADSATPLDELSAADAQTRLTALEAEWAAADKMDVPTLDLLMEKIQSVRAELEAAG
jgi:F-type H+-transporting ATPase subunit epsilon